MPAGGPASSTGSSSSGSSAGVIAPFVNELDRMAPSFDLRGDQISIIKTPADFYETLKVREIPSLADLYGSFQLAEYESEASLR